MTAERIAPDIFRLAVEHNANGMIIYEPDGGIVLANRAAERMFGSAHGKLCGRPIELLLPGCLQCEEDADLTAPAREPIGIRTDGSQFPAELHLRAMATGDRHLMLATITDISERRRHEHLKDEFVSTVSHELRTPLTSIAGSLGLLAGGAAGAMPEAAMRLLKIAHKNSERLVRLINDLLDIQKIESGKLVLDLKRIELSALIEQAIEANRGYAQTFGVRVVLEPVVEPLYVRADPDRLVQVVTNLLSNACKFSPLGGEVSVSLDAPRNDSVRTCVRDHGAGIPQNFRTRIFDKFAQADAADARQKGGTGLGLSIVKQIVTLHGGSVGFRDAEGGGTIFYIDLPRWDAVNGAALQSGDLILIRDPGVMASNLAPVDDRPLPL